MSLAPGAPATQWLTTMRTPKSATITVSTTKQVRAPRSKRQPAPTTKVRENQALRRTRRATRAQSPEPLHFRDIEDSDDDYDEDNEDRPQGSETLVELVKELVNTVKQQNEDIKEAQTALRELKEEQQKEWDEKNGLKDEISMLRDQVTTLLATLPSAQSWASLQQLEMDPSLCKQPRPPLSLAPTAVRGKLLAIRRRRICCTVRSTRPE